MDLILSWVQRHNANTLTSNIFLQESMEPSVSVSAVLRPALLLQTSTLPKSGLDSIQVNMSLISASTCMSHFLAKSFPFFSFQRCCKVHNSFNASATTNHQ